MSDTLTHTLTDTLTQVVDSTAVVEPIVEVLTVAPAVRYPGTPLPSLPITEDWVAATLMILALFIFIALKFSPHIIKRNLLSFFSNKERESIFLKSTNWDTPAQVFLGVFSIGTIALALYLQFYKGEEFLFTAFLSIMAMVLLFLGAKYLLFRFLAYVFFNKKIFLIARRHFFQWLTLGSLVIYPLLLLHVYFPDLYAPLTTPLYIASALFLTVVFAVKVFQLFFQKTVALLYILLYLCTLEILPLYALVLGIKHIVLV